MICTSVLFWNFSCFVYCNVFADEYYMDYKMINEQDVQLIGRRSCAEEAKKRWSISSGI